MKKFLLVILFMPAIAKGADITKQLMNPFTGRPDYINNLSSTSVGALVDVSTLSVTNGQCLSYNSTSKKFEPATCGGGGASVYAATATASFPFGMSLTTMTFTGQTSTGTLKSSAGVVSVSTYALVTGFPCFADGGASAVVSGSTRAFVAPYDFTISSWTVIADTTGTISVDIKRSTFANYPNYTTIVGASGNKPSLTSTIKNSATPTSWTATYINAGDTVACVVDQSTTSTWWQVLLWGTKL